MEVAQAAHITRLNAELKTIHDRMQRQIDEANNRADRMETGYNYYMAMQEAAKKHESVMECWQQLLVVIKLANDEAIPGLTEARKSGSPHMSHYYRSDAYLEQLDLFDDEPNFDDEPDQ